MIYSMPQSRYSLHATGAMFAAIILFSALVVDSQSLLEKAADANHPVQSGDHQNLRLKRMSQISCHCCSNSFNSHCCLQCMRSVGKRTGGDSTATINPHVESTDDLSEEYNDQVSGALVEGLSDWTEEAAMCSCCFRQMDRQPYSGRWPCCDSCSYRFRPEANIDKTHVNTL